MVALYSTWNHFVYLIIILWKQESSCTRRKEIHLLILKSKGLHVDYSDMAMILSALCCCHLNPLYLSFLYVCLEVTVYFTGYRRHSLYWESYKILPEFHFWFAHSLDSGQIQKWANRIIYYLGFILCYQIRDWANSTQNESAKIRQNYSNMYTVWYLLFKRHWISLCFRLLFSRAH